MGLSSTRREILCAIPGTGLMVSATTGMAKAEMRRPDIASDLQRYVDFGAKGSGGPGDMACGAWLEARLQALGFKTRRQSFPVPFGDQVGAIVVNAVETPLWSFPTQVAAAFQNTPLAHLEDPKGIEGCIALAALPFRRWSSASTPLIQDLIDSARLGRASGLILITDGPTGETVALNLRADQPPPLPVATIGSRRSADLKAAAWRRAPVAARFGGHSGAREAYNLIGDLGNVGPRIVVSTPRSGWFACGGERGPGVAAWLRLAQILAAARVRSTLVTTSGHEFEGLGAEHFLASEAPSPEAVDAWVHLGANLATRDARDIGATLDFLPSADPQRYLVAHDRFAAAAGSAFASQPGLERIFAPQAGSAGELKNLAQHGYERVLGIFGAHRLHHTAIDDERAVSPSLAEEVIVAIASVLEQSFPGALTKANGFRP